MDSDGELQVVSFDFVIPGPAAGRNQESSFGSCKQRLTAFTGTFPMRSPTVYMLASQPNGTLYIGVTSDLIKRAWEHRTDAVVGFTQRYGVHRLVYFEQFRSMTEAIEREKELKKWRRAWKIALIETENQEWRDLWPEIVQ